MELWDGRGGGGWFSWLVLVFCNKRECFVISHDGPGGHSLPLKAKLGGIENKEDKARGTGEIEEGGDVEGGRDHASGGGRLW